MPTFILSEEPPTIRIKDGKEHEEPGRVILDRQSHGRVLHSIEAEPIQQSWRVKSAWCVARDKVDEEKFMDTGNGWYSIESLEKVGN